MKTLKIFPFVALFMALATLGLPKGSFAQKTIPTAIGTETIPVSGNCGMCKSNIEKAAKKAGAADAKWDVDEKTLTVKYNSSTTNAAKIQESVAAAGYDTRDVKTTNEAYDKLHGCCKYDRVADVKKGACCSEKCEMKDGKCTDMPACKDKGCCTADGVCKDAASCNHKDGHDAKAACCKKLE